jgi:hypothetical protein
MAGKAGRGGKGALLFSGDGGALGAWLLCMSSRSNPGF